MGGGEVWIYLYWSSAVNGWGCNYRSACRERVQHGWCWLPASGFQQTVYGPSVLWLWMDLPRKWRPNALKKDGALLGDGIPDHSGMHALSGQLAFCPNNVSSSIRWFCILASRSADTTEAYSDSEVQSSSDGGLEREREGGSVSIFWRDYYRLCVPGPRARMRCHSFHLKASWCLLWKHHTASAMNLSAEHTDFTSCRIRESI